MENENLATELLRQIKANARRWFIAFLVMVGIELLTIAGFIWYISLPAEEVAIEQDADDHSFNVISGGNYNGSEAESNIQEESNSEKE